MPRNITLGQLINDLRYECGYSENSAVSRGTRSKFIYLLNRHQRRLWRKKDWQFLDIQRDIQLQAGSRYYDFPTDIDMDRSHRIEAKYQGFWHDVHYKITNVELAGFDSDNDERVDYVQRWDYYLEDSSNTPQMEVWPIPSADGDANTLDGYLRVHGIHKISDMVSDSDTCLIDSDLIVLSAAVEVLTKIKSPEASTKLELLNDLLKDMSSDTNHSEPFKIGGDTYDEDRGGRYDPSNVIIQGVRAE